MNNAYPEDVASSSGKGKKGPAGGEDGETHPFARLSFKIGKIVKIWEHPDSDKLFCEEIDLGEGSLRKVASGLRGYYKAEELLGKMVVVLSNLKERSIGGFPSHGMVRMMSLLILLNDMGGYLISFTFGM